MIAAPATALRIASWSRFGVSAWTRHTDSNLKIPVRHYQPPSSALRTPPSPRSRPISNPHPSTLSKASFNTSAPSSPRPESPNDVYTSPYKAQRLWPPDMSKLSEKQQFRLERKYRRRAKLKWARPTWKKWTTVVQWGTIGFVVIYSVFFMELKDGGTNPFQTLRESARKFFAESVWSSPRGARRNDIDAGSRSNESKQS